MLGFMEIGKAVSVGPAVARLTGRAGARNDMDTGRGARHTSGATSETPQSAGFGREPRPRRLRSATYVLYRPSSRAGFPSPALAVGPDFRRRGPRHRRLDGAVVLRRRKGEDRDCRVARA